MTLQLLADEFSVQTRFEKQNNARARFRLPERAGGHAAERASAKSAMRTRADHVGADTLGPSRKK